MRRSRNSKAPPAPSVDNISHLPDDILSRVISFLTTKEAVRTSVLSKRWTNVWQFCDSITFTGIQVYCIRSNRKFNKSVNSVLGSNDSHSINTFCLEILYGHPHVAYRLSFPNIVKWVNLVVHRHLKNLCLHLDVDEYDDEDNNEDEHFLPKLPTSIFTCETLVTLDLRRFRVEGFSFSSNEFRFPSLKTLLLDDVEFNRGRDFLLLLSGCPILEDLLLFHVYFHCMNVCGILKEFKSLSLPKLSTAKITESVWDCLPLEALTTSKSLCLDVLKHHPSFKVNHPHGPYDDVPIFDNLTCLKLHDSWDLVLKVLHHCPKLQDLKLYEEMLGSRRIGDDDEETWVEPVIVPQCLLSNLISCTIKNIGGLQRELRLATYILKNAKILQTMKIKISYSCRREQSEIERKMSLCLKASPACQLLVY